jgi:hypothetical protein
LKLNPVMSSRNKNQLYSWYTVLKMVQIAGS